jgi:glycosyltransferase involved in cell wall biosynthesis
MRAASVVVVIPTLNEQGSIADVVRGIPRPPVETVIVADSPSTDATAARAAEAGAEVIKVERGCGRACAAEVQVQSRPAVKGRYGSIRASGRYGRECISLQTLAGHTMLRFRLAETAPSGEEHDMPSEWLPCAKGARS